MRFAKIACFTIFCICSAQAMADSRVFIVANQPDGYGIDQCLANGEQCGMPAARAYCLSREFNVASAFRRIDPAEVTGAIPATTESICTGSVCAQHIAITCER